MSSSQEPKISGFLSGKPTIEAVEQSSLLSRLRNFLPQMEEANRNMPENTATDAIQIENSSKQESSDDSSDDGSDSENNLDDTVGNKTGDMLETNCSPRIEIDLDVFKEENSTVDGRDASILDVESLPEAFQPKSDGQKKEELKKQLIEEL